MGNASKSGMEAGRHRSGEGSLVAEGCKFDGTFTFSGPVTISGMVTGDITCDDMLVIEQSGAVDGHVSAAVVIIKGKFAGDVLASESLEMWAGSQVDGKVYARTVKVDAGSKLTAEMSIASERPKWAEKPTKAPEPPMVETPAAANADTPVPGTGLARKLAAMND